MGNEVIDFKTKYPIIDWMGYEWCQDMPGGDKLHPYNPYRYYHPDGVKRVGNEIRLSVVKVPRTVTRWDGKTYDSKYACGLLRSKECFTFGTFYANCILPKGRNLLPAFWLTNEKTWPPEIDIFEGYPNVCGGYWTPSIRPHKPLIKQGYAVEPNLHYGTSEDRIKVGAVGCEINVLDNPASESNLYILEWYPTYVAILYNGHLVKYIDDKENPELFKQLNGHPWMYVIFDNVIHKKGTCEVGAELIVKDFTYRSIPHVDYLTYQDI